MAEDIVYATVVVSIDAGVFGCIVEEVTEGNKDGEVVGAIVDITSVDPNVDDEVNGAKEYEKFEVDMIGTTVDEELVELVWR